MENNKLSTLASDSQKCQHLYLRGNFQQDMFYDKVDMVNVWNRLWLSAEATNVQILSAGILNNHLHLTCIFQNDKQRANFKHHLRLSITQYHNHRYGVHGTLGTRTLKHAPLRDLEDIKDCICYHIRNVLHHSIADNYLDYSYSTARFVFGLVLVTQQGIYSRETLPVKLASAYLPCRAQLPKGWTMTREGLIVPPIGVFRADIVEELFECSRDTYLETLSQRTTRETSNQDEPTASHSRKCQNPDEQIVEFVKTNCRVQIPAMSQGQKMAAILQIIENQPKTSIKLLARIFGIPYSTLRYRIKISRYVYKTNHNWK